MAPSSRYLAFAALGFVSAACAARDAQPVSKPTTTIPQRTAAAPPPATPMAPRDAIFLAESGAVTFAWTIEVPGSDVQHGEGKLVFDRWGHRQATSGYPGPVAEKVVIFDQKGLTSYFPAMHSAVTTRWNAIEAFSAEERRVLTQALPPSKQTQGSSKTVAGLPCVEKTTEQQLPMKGVAIHTACIARGIELETSDTVAGGMMNGFKTSMVAIEVDLSAKIEDARFAIPEDVKRIIMGEGLADAEHRQEVLDAVRTMTHDGESDRER